MAYLYDAGIAGNDPRAAAHAASCATRSAPCAAACRAVATPDPVSAMLVDLLDRPIAAHQSARIAHRAAELRALVTRLDPADARRLLDRLNNRADPLGRFLDCELSPELSAELRARLLATARRQQAGPAIVVPDDPSTGPTPLGPTVPGLRTPPVQPTQPPIRPTRKPPVPPPPVEPIFDPPRQHTPWIRITELLKHARGVVTALQTIGYTAGTVTALAAAIAEVTSLMTAFPVLSIPASLAFDITTGTMTVPASAHYLDKRWAARAQMTREWSQLENALQRLHRLDVQATEQFRDAQGRFQKRQPGDSPPGSGFEDEVCRRVAKRYRYSARQVYLKRYQPGAGMPGQAPSGQLRLADPVAKVDCVGAVTPNGGLRLYEAKSSGLPNLSNPGMSANQRIAYAGLAQYGGEIVADKGPFRTGTQIPRGTTVTIVTPANIDLVLPE